MKQAQFFGRLRADHLEGKWWRTVESIGFYSVKFDITIYVPPGFVTDFASVPRVPGAFLFFGDTGHWESLLHDMLYRFGHKRLQADSIFYEAGRVRAKMRNDQGLLKDIGRMIRSGVMAGTTAAIGWTVYDPIPGCLDYREVKKCGKNCIGCNSYFPFWNKCVAPGFVPSIRL